MAFAQTLRIFHKIMLAILRIWLCLFCENFSILTKSLILGQPPSTTVTTFSAALDLCTTGRSVVHPTGSRTP